MLQNGVHNFDKTRVDTKYVDNTKISCSIDNLFYITDLFCSNFNSLFCGLSPSKDGLKGI